jgi:hypothetical protein
VLVAQAHKVKAEAAGLTLPLFVAILLRWHKRLAALASLFVPTSPPDQGLYLPVHLG